MSKIDARPLKAYKDILPNEIADDRAYAEIFDKIAPYTMTARDGLETTYALFQAVKYVCHNTIRGDIVECGVWRGGSMMLVAFALSHFGDTSRELYLYDTFAGMTEPSEIDVDFDNVAYKPRWKQITGQGGLMGFGDTAEGVKANLLRTGYPERQMHFVVGDVLQTIPATMPSRISLLRLDTDWYQSTLHELEHLYELLVPHGVLIIDDYGWCRGSRKATDEFFQQQPFKPMMHRVDQGPRVIIKPYFGNVSEKKSENPTLHSRARRGRQLLREQDRAWRNRNSR
jgi:O-methyltransferase